MAEIAFNHPSRAIMTPLPPPTLDASSAIGPDLSHLTDQERHIIESVMMRQKQVEAEEAQVLKKKQDEVVILENAIRMRNEEQKKLGIEMEATCQICLKTKFADGVGHICNYCGTRCCARCGGKVALRSNKNIWVCILCRKKQELLIKTGQWIHSSMANRLKQLETESELSSTPLFERFISFTSAGIGAQNQTQNQNKDRHTAHSHSQSQSQSQSQSTIEQQMLNSGNVCLNFIRRSSLGILPGSPKTHPIREQLRRQFSHESQQQQQQRQQQRQHQQQPQQYVPGQHRPGSVGAQKLWGFRTRSFEVDDNNEVGQFPSSHSSPRRHILPQQPPIKVQLLQHQSKSEPRSVVTSLAGLRKMPQLPIRAHSHGHTTSASAGAGQVPSHSLQHYPQQPSQLNQPLHSHQPNLPHHPNQPNRPNQPIQSGHSNQQQQHHQPYPSSALPGTSMIDVNQSSSLPASSLPAMVQQVATVGHHQLSSGSSQNVPSIDSHNPNVTTTSASIGGRLLHGQIGTTSSSSRKLPFQRQKSRELPVLEGILSKSATVDTGNTNYSSLKKQLPCLPLSSLAKSTGNLYQMDLSNPNISSTAAYTRSVPSDSHSYSGEGFYPRASGKGSSSLSSLYHYQKKSSGQYNLARSSGIGSGRSLPGPFDIGDSGVGESLMLRTDSLSSDQSEMVVRRSPVKSQHYLAQSSSQPAHHHHQLHPKLRLRDGRRFRLYKSLSSSEDEVRSTPEFSTEDDFDLESESFSEQALVASSVVPEFSRSRALKPDDILDAKMRNFLVHPITWKLSPEGAYMIGHMILKKHLANDSTFGSSSAMLGLKVVGGRVVESGRLGALIEKVRKGGIADTIGRLRPGDEVLEWNQISLKGKTYEEVHDLIVESRQNPQVELLISRPTKNKLGAIHPASAMPQQRSPAAIRDQFIQQNRIGRRHTDVLTGTGVCPIATVLDYDKSTFTRGSSLGAELTARTSGTISGHHHLLPKTPVQLTANIASLGTTTGPVQLPTSLTAGRSPPLVKVVTRSSTISGRIQVKLWYDSQTLELMVTIVNAVELSPRKTGLSRNPYVKMYLLPDLRSERTTRRTKTAVNTNEPLWNQTFVYTPIHHTELKLKTLDLTVWDYDRYCANELLGQVAIDLATAPMNLPPSIVDSADTGEWYYLASHDEIIAQLPHHLKSHFINERFSPSPTISRLSDSELSELDYDDDYNNSRESWRALLADTSQSSLGSSGSPPLVSSASVSASGCLLGVTAASAENVSFGANAASVPVAAPTSSSSSQSVHRLSALRAQSSAGQYYPGSGGGLPIDMQPSRPGLGHRFQRQHRHEIISSSSLPGSSMYLGGTLPLPTGHHTQYPAQAHLHHRYPSMRPEFRKSSSQPTDRSLSPPVVCSPLSSSTHYLRQSALYPSGNLIGSKRHLPSIPSSVPHFPLQQLGIEPSAAALGAASTSIPLPPANAYPVYQQSQPSDVLGPSLALSRNTPPPHAIYSDSEITLKPVFGNRPLYAHPVTREQQHFYRQQRFQQQCRSTDDLHQPYFQRGSGQRASALQHQSSLAGPVSRRAAASAAYHSDSFQSESDSIESAAAQRVSEQAHHHPPRRLSQRRHSRHSRDQHSSMVSVDYRELKNAEDDEDYDEEEGTTTEYDEHSDQMPRRRGTNHHHHQSQQRQTTQSSHSRKHPENELGRRESQSKSDRSQSAGDRRSSRQLSRSDHNSRQTSSSGRQSQPGTVHDSDNVQRQQQPQQPQPQLPQPQPQPQSQQQQQDNSETESSNSKQSSSQSAYTGRPKGSRTLSEFTGRSQQHSGPVHPPHPSRSGLAVARSMSERSKDDGKMDHKPQTPASKSYADQIDEVMEQLNANCDLSMDDLYGAATSASTSTLNASTSTADKKEGKKGRKGGGGAVSADQGLTKKSNSTSQLSVTGTKKRLGFRKKQATSFSVHRSEEVLPDDVRHMVKQYSSVSSDGDGSISGDSSYTWLTTLKCEDEYSSFLGDTGPGQICSRQGLVEVDLGELQLGVCLRKNGILEVEVIRAHGLRTKYGSKLPSIYVKVYLIRDRDIVAKAKTTRSRRTLEPFFKQSLLFSDEFQGCQLNCMVYGEYGKLQRDVFMGVVQIELKDVDLPVGFTNKYFKIYSSFADIPPSTGTKITNDHVQDPHAIPGTSGSYNSGGDPGGRGSLAGSGGSGPASLLSASMESFS